MYVAVGPFEKGLTKLHDLFEAGLVTLTRKHHELSHPEDLLGHLDRLGLYVTHGSTESLLADILPGLDHKDKLLLHSFIGEGTAV